MTGPYRWDRSLHDKAWRVASCLLIALAKIPGCYNLAARIDEWRVDG
jgi:hypothetical protein